MINRLVAITGATGFIGSHLCDHLLSQGFDVRLLARNPDAAQHLVDRGASVIAGDLEDTQALGRLVDGAGAVIHAAGAVRGNCQQAFDSVNVAGTASILAAIKSASSTARLLLLSSLAAREPQLSWYAHSKWEAEQLLLQEENLDWTILRPPAVYGPGDKEMLPIFQWMARGIALVPGSPAARTSLIHVEDLVSATTQCLGTPATRGQLFYACDGKAGGYSWPELAAVAESLWLRKVRIWQVPQWLLNGVARSNMWLTAVSGNAPMLTPPKLKELRHQDWVVDNTAMTTTTGWQPNIGLREGLETLGIAVK